MHPCLLELLQKCFAENHRHYSAGWKDETEQRVKQAALLKLKVKGSETIENKQIERMKDQDTRVQTPKKCIKAYCLMVCEKKGRKNSKRDVVECIERECPLHPYRTGMLKARSGPKNEQAKTAIIEGLERARKNVGKANERYLKKWKELEETKLRFEATMEDKRAELEEEMRQKQEHFNKRYLDRIQAKEREVKAEEAIVEKRKDRLKKLEIIYLEQLEAGHWINDETEGVDGEEKESEEHSV